MGTVIETFYFLELRLNIVKFQQVSSLTCLLLGGVLSFVITLSFLGIKIMTW